MTFKTLTSIFVLPIVPVVALALALTTGAASVSAASDRNKPLHLTKECTEYFGNAGDWCTITISNLRRIPVDSRILYSQAMGVHCPGDGIVCDLDGTYSFKD
jgi:hypothetical protein